MKVLISNNFKALRQGEFVSANADVGEFIFDSENCEDMAIATLLEISSGNDLSVKKAKKSIVVENLTTQLKSLELQEMNEITDSQKVAEIVAAGVEAGSDDEVMLLEIIQAGIKFKVAGKLFAQAMQAGGYRITSKARKEQGRAILVDAEFTPESYEALQAMIEQITDEVDDTTTSQAHAICKAYAKEFEIELPKPAKKASGGIKSKITSWIVANPTASVEDLLGHIDTLGPFPKEGRAEVLTKRYAFVLEVAGAVAAA